MAKDQSFIKNYSFSIILIASILAGSVLGFILKEKSVVLKPLGDIFLNLLFTAVVPLVFFSIASAVCSMTSIKRLGRILGAMFIIFVLTGILSSLWMVAAIKMFPIPKPDKIIFEQAAPSEKIDVGQKIKEALTVNDFYQLLDKKNMLALIVFALLVGLATLKAEEKGKPFAGFLHSGTEVMMKVIAFIMTYSPIGLGAYFAYLIGNFGPQLLGSYFRTIILYYPAALLYFFIGFTFYAFISAGMKGVKIFWSNIIPASLTAWGTGSSIASIPLNLEAAKRMRVPEDIREVVIPIGSSMHSDGSCLAAILKIAFLFTIFWKDFSGFGTIIVATCVAMLCGTVICGIPQGGMIGEMLIISFYGLPLAALPVISMIGTLVDPPATMVNVAGDAVSSMLIGRFLGGKDWMEKTET